MDETQDHIQELCHALAKVPESHRQGMDGCKRLLQVKPLHEAAGLAREMLQIAEVYNRCHAPITRAVLRRCIDVFLPFTILTAEQFVQSGRASISAPVRSS